MTPVTTAALAPDPVLAGRDRLLDADAMAAHLSRLLGTDGPIAVASARLTLVKYRWAESLRVVYELDTVAGRQVVAARVFASAELAARAAVAAVAAGVAACTHDPARHRGLHAVALDREHDAVWFTAPHDRRLRGLGALDTPLPHLAALPGGRWVGTELVQCAPERSATLRCLDADGATVGYAKLYRHAAQAADLARCYDHVVRGLALRGAGVRVPAAVTHDAALGVLVLEPMAGVGWNELEPSRLPLVARVIGAGLAEVHGLGRHGRPPFERHLADKVARSVELLVEARPDVAELARGVGERLAATVPVASAPVLLHGDVHPKNVLVDGDRVHLIDLDQAGWGSAAADMGSMIARLRHGVLVGETAGGTAGPLAASFLHGYATVRPVVSAAELRWHTAAALVVERALRAVTRLHPAGLAVLAGTLADAHAVLDGRDDL